MLEIVSHSPEETAALGAQLGRLLVPGCFVALMGELGAGKTQLAKGIAQGLEVARDTPVTSPSYTILNIYQGRLPLYHFDLYRLQDGQEVVDLGFEEYFYGNGVCLVEWAERLEEGLPADALSVCCRHLGEESRSIVLSASGRTSTGILALLEAALTPVGSASDRDHKESRDHKD